MTGNGSELVSLDMSFGFKGHMEMTFRIPINGPN